MASIAKLLRIFSNLNLETAVKKSEPTPKYNCIAFAAGDEAECWWPNEDGYWPDSVPREETIEAFVAAYATEGFAACDSGDLEEGYDKIAIYAIAGVPTHATRQLPDGKWVSKLGELEDIQHDTLAELEGEAYGRVVWFLRRIATKG
jgi:hypothetical protein